MTCQVKGYNTSMSAMMICNKELAYFSHMSYCNDGLDSWCVYDHDALSCVVHKHQLCDGHIDCFDESDENRMECYAMTTATCHRRYRHATPLSLPLSWLKDGRIDCVTGEDEEDVWPVCKVAKSNRYKAAGMVCENVFLCGLESIYFVELERGGIRRYSRIRS